MRIRKHISPAEVRQLATHVELEVRRCFFDMLVTVAPSMPPNWRKPKAPLDPEIAKLIEQLTDAPEPPTERAAEPDFEIAEMMDRLRRCK